MNELVGWEGLLGGGDIVLDDNDDDFLDVEQAGGDEADPVRDLLNLYLIKSVSSM